MDKLRAETLKECDKQHVWHPFTPMSGYLEQDVLLIERGEGVYLFDSEGRRYIDGVSSLWANIHGHRRKEIDSAIRAQLEKIAHSTLLGPANEPASELAGKLAEILPEGLTRVFYSDSGAAAVEVALKLAFGYWKHRGVEGKHGFIALEEGYHGDTLGAVSVGGMSLFHEFYRELAFETRRLPSPHCLKCPCGEEPDRCRLECAAEAEEFIARYADETAAVIIEPIVQGAGGMLVQPEGYLSRLREAAEKNGVLFIADEVATGFGRTGKMFACEHESVVPDIMTLGKGITGGYLPVSATVTTEDVFEAYLGSGGDGKTFFHGHTYSGNPLGCAAALGSLSAFANDNTLESMQPKIAHLSELLEPLKQHPHVLEIRQKGFMVGIELVRSREPVVEYDPSERMGARVCFACRPKGVLLRPLGDVIVLMPPLVSSMEVLEAIVAAVREAIDEVSLDQ